MSTFFLGFRSDSETCGRLTHFVFIGRKRTTCSCLSSQVFCGPCFGLTCFVQHLPLFVYLQWLLGLVFVSL
uniref:Uncharacterized protein n=1 Tax=Anguilla anguilla TaxID=7936 RepID=A0A0E9TR14_ANGAN